MFLLKKKQFFLLDIQYNNVVQRKIYVQCNVKITEHGDEIIEYIPGVTTTCIADLPAKFFL